MAAAKLSLYPTARASKHRAPHPSSGSPTSPSGVSLDDGVRLSKAAVKPMCASGYPPRLDPKTLSFYVPPRDPSAPLLAPQPVKPVPAKPMGPRPGWAVERGE